MNSHFEFSIIGYVKLISFYVKASSTVIQYTISRLYINMLSIILLIIVTIRDIYSENEAQMLYQNIFSTFYRHTDVIQMFLIQFIKKNFKKLFFPISIIIVHRMNIEVCIIPQNLMLC